MLRNVLIFHAGALGDFVRSWPLGLALGRLYPQSRVIYITHRQKGQLAEECFAWNPWTSRRVGIISLAIPLNCRSPAE